jgi:outer membrane protein OmpA-like peptidoglycan-associated protein
MNTNCLNITKAILMSAMLIGGKTLLAQAQTSSKTVTDTTIHIKLVNKEKFNRISLGFRLSHLYDIQYNGFRKLNGTDVTDPSGLNGSKTKFDMATGMNLNYFITNKISLDLAYDKGKMTGQTNDANEYYESKVSFLTFGLNFDLKGNKRVKPYKLVPFLRASASRSTYDTKRKYVSDDKETGTSSGATMQIGLGGGMRYHVNNHWHFNFQTEFVQTFTDAWDGWDYGSGRDYMAKTSVGLCFSFGNNMHLDRVVNKHSPIVNIVTDTLPNNASSNNMLAVSDSLKKINQKIAKMLADIELLTKDSDGDGIPDFKDQCPEVKGTFINGCNEMDVLKTGGLLGNNVNKLANNKEPIDKSNGIVSNNNPSGNNTSIPNVGNNLKLELRSMLLVELNKIYFRTNKSNLNANNRAILTQCAQVIMDNPSFKLTILGYADNMGNDEANLILSKNRAEAVSNFLENQGVSKSNIIIKAMGAVKMIGTDAKKPNLYNRRVEFILE